MSPSIKESSRALSLTLRLGDLDRPDGSFAAKKNGHSRNRNKTNKVDVSAMRSSITDVDQLIDSFGGLLPLQRGRRCSRNSFDAALPIPRVKQPSTLSLPPTRPTFDTLAARAQDLDWVKSTAAKNMAFVFDIDGVLVHGDRLIPEGRRVLEILNGDNELGIKVIPALIGQG